MNLEEIEKLIALFEKSNIAAMDLETEQFKIRLEREGAAKVSVVKSLEEKQEAPKDEESHGSYVTSPLVGTFHQAPYPNAKAFVSVGGMVKKGDKLCIIEAMKVMNEIKSPYDGIVKKILVSDGDLVEYGQNLFEIGDANV